MHNSDSKVLALFDFDGTITYRDSFLVFIKFYWGALAFWKGFLWLMPWVIAFKLKLINNQALKEKVLRYFFQGQSMEVFQQKANAFAEQIIPAMLRPQAIAQLRAHLEAGHLVCIVSASIENYLQAWAEKEGFDLLATRLVHQNGTITGQIAGKNCQGAAKLEFIRQRFDLDKYTTIYAYGDTPGDLPMLALAQERHYKPFR